MNGWHVAKPADGLQCLVRYIQWLWLGEMLGSFNTQNNLLTLGILFKCDSSLNYSMPERDFHQPFWTSGKTGKLLCYHDKKMPFYIKQSLVQLTLLLLMQIFSYLCNALFNKILTVVKVVQPLWNYRTFYLPGFACSVPLSGYIFVFAKNGVYEIK